MKILDQISVEIKDENNVVQDGTVLQEQKDVMRVSNKETNFFTHQKYQVDN